MSAAKKEETKFSDKEVAEVAAECVGLDDGREIDLRAIAYLKRTRAPLSANGLAIVNPPLDLTPAEYQHALDHHAPACECEICRVAWPEEKTCEACGGELDSDWDSDGIHARCR